MNGAMIKGWCPGTLRPMATGDGWLMRVKLPAGRTRPETLQAIANIGQRFGASAFDLSRRGQLQIRGLSGHTLPMAREALADLGLWPADADHERGFCILASPAMALNAHAPAYGIFSRLQEILTSNKSFRALPGKFGFALDDGGAFSVVDAHADIVICLEKSAKKTDHTTVFLYVAGEDARAVKTTLDRAAGDAAALAQIFLDYAGSCDARRMRALTQHKGADAIFASLKLEPVAHPMRMATPLANILGVQAWGGRIFVGAAAPYGRWSAATLKRLAQAALRRGVVDIGISHRRAFLLHVENLDQARRLAQDLQTNELLAGAAHQQDGADEGLILDARDGRLALAVCPGRPDCASAFIDTRGAAQRFASLIAEAKSAALSAARTSFEADACLLHLSGCAKGCANPAPALWTLRGAQNGFDLVENGSAAGSARISGLTLDEAYCEIARRVSGLPAQ